MYGRKYKLDVGRMIMKNKFLYLILSMIMCFSFVGEVFAEDEFSSSVTINGGKDTFEKGKEAIINVNIKDNSYVELCTFDVVVDSGLEFLSSKTLDGYSFETNDGGKFVVKGNDAEATSTNGNLLQLSYKVNDSGKFKINYSCEHKGDSEKVVHDSLSHELELKVIDLSQDTTLSKLVVNGGILSPSFLPNVENYSIQLSGVNFSLDLTATNPDYQDDIVVTDGNGLALEPSKITFNNYNNQGNMPINIIVNKDTVYSLLAVYKEEELDNSLKSLKVDGKEIQIESGKYDYTFKIGNSTNNVKIEATLVDSDNFKYTDEFNGTQIVQTPSSSTGYPIIIEPKSSSAGAKGVTYTIKLVKDVPNNSGGTTSDNNGQNANKNPATGGISMYLMLLILIISLIGSISIYQKNLANYDKN